MSDNDLVHVHIEGTFLVLLRRDGRYEAHVRMTGSGNLLIGVGKSAREAIAAALQVPDDPQ